MKKYYYDGSMYMPKMSDEVFRAYNIWNSQRSRCVNKKTAAFKRYGAKGIRVEYSAREFIGWWLENIKTKKWKQPSCGRVDHSKNYSFDNIEMQEKSDNSKERIIRAGNPVLYKQRSVIVTTDETSIVLPSVKEAAKWSGRCVQTVITCCQRGRPDRTGIYFKYAEFI